MTSNLVTNLVRLSGRNSRRSSVSLLAVTLALVVLPVHAQTFSSGSDGSDGAYAPTGPSGTVIVFNPAQFTGTQVAANIFNFTTITIPSGVTVKLSGSTLNGPVYWLASGNVDIEGTVDLSGGPGAAETMNPFLRVPSVPGSGGYIGGVGGNSAQPALSGSGPGGGAASVTGAAGPGTFSGNQFLIPLVGGSGGGGGLYGNQSTYFCDGGGAGGGALLIASSTQITVNGLMNANGGSYGASNNICGGAAGGSGGAVRLVSNTVAGGGSLTASGGSGSGGSTNGGPGVIRLEATTVSFPGGNVSGTYAQSTPFPLLLPTAGPPSAQVISINGTSVTPNPNTFPDITINTTSAVNVVIQTQNIPTTATITLTILDENGVADTVVQAPPLGGCNASNVCTTTAQVMFPFGASRGLTRVTWTQ